MSEDGLERAATRRPATIEAALRGLLQQRYGEHEGYVPARVLNMVAIVDREWKGEIQNRLERVGRYHASRTIICAVEPGRTTLDAWALAALRRGPPEPGQFALTHEDVEVDVGPQPRPEPGRRSSTRCWCATSSRSCGRRTGTPRRSTRCSSSPTSCCWTRSRSSTWPAALGAGRRAGGAPTSWTSRGCARTPWRERIAATFDPPDLRPALEPAQRRDGPPSVRTPRRPR